MARVVGLDDIRAARSCHRGVVASTPVLRPARSRAGRARACVLKAENLQHTGSFKIRGAVNRLAT